MISTKILFTFGLLLAVTVAVGSATVGFDRVQRACFNSLFITGVGTIGALLWKIWAT